MRQYEYQIKDEICTLLNSGGGILLFGCKMNHGKLLPIGEVMSEFDKERYSQIVTNYLKVLESPSSKLPIRIDFVPVIYNVEKDGEKEYTCS